MRERRVMTVSPIAHASSSDEATKKGRSLERPFVVKTGRRRLKPAATSSTSLAAVGAFGIRGGNVTGQLPFIDAGWHRQGRGRRRVLGAERSRARVDDDARGG